MNTKAIEVALSEPITLSPLFLPVVIGFFFAFRLFDVLIAVRLLGQDAQIGVGAGLALNYLLFVGVVFYSIGPNSTSMRSMRQLPMARWVLLFLCFTGVSLLWSGTTSLAAATAFWLAMATDTAMIVLLLRKGPADAVIDGVMTGYIWGACIIAAIAWLLPSQSDLRLGDEELLGPNQIGYVCAFAFFFTQYRMRFMRRALSLPAVLLAVTLLRSLSKTTIIAFIAGQSYILLRDRSLSRRTKWVLAFSAALVLAIFWGLLENYYGIYTNAGNQADTLTGRLGLWAYFLSEAIQQPWIGHGFHSVWKIIPPFGPDQFEARHAHNELLQQFYAYGVMGVFMFVAIYGSLLRNLHRLAQSSLKTFFLGMLIFVLVRGLADTEPFDLSLPMWTIVMIGSLIQQNKNRSEVLA